MHFINDLTIYLTFISTIFPLEQFVLFGSFIEEIIAPIPSPLVMTISGSISKAREYPLLFIAWLALIGAVGKTFGAWLLYLAALKIENIFSGKLGKFLLISQEETTFLRKRMDQGWKNYLILFAARAAPVIPSAPLSVTCGLIKFSIIAYLIITLAGTTIRNLLFIYFGYMGIANYKLIIGGLETTESIMQITIFILLAIIIFWLYYKHHKFKKRIK